MAGQGGIVCPNGHDAPVNVDTARFCRVCGGPLLRKCPEGHLSAADGRFCRTCGAVMGGDPPQANDPTAASAAARQHVAEATTNSVSTTQRVPPSHDDFSRTVPTSVGGHIESEVESPLSSKKGGPGGPWLIVAIVAVVVVLGLAAGLLFVVSSGHSPSKNAGSSLTNEPSRSVTRTTVATNSTTSSSSTTSTKPSEQQAAQALSVLLAQSVADRSAINTASTDVSECGPNLSQDQQMFTTAGSSRQSLISQLSTEPGISALPAPMISSLSGAWQASEQVDEDYAKWTADEVSSCTPNDTADPNYQAALTPNQTATQDKMTFASAWDSIAAMYNLPTYQWNQL